VSAPSAPLSLAAFAFGRVLKNATLRNLRRLREPRYMVGFLLGAAYFAMIFTRPGGRSGRPPAPFRLPAPGSELLLLAGAAALAVVTLLLWLFRRGEPALGLTEAEIQLLFPAPVSRRALLHYSLLKAQIPALFSAFIITLVTGRRGSGSALLTGAGLWMLLTATHLHNLALSFTKARWSELPTGARRATRAAAFLACVGALAVLLVSLGAGVAAGASGLSAGSVSSPLELGLALRSGPFGALPFALLAPFRWILAPAFAADARSFGLALPGALFLLAALYAWLARTAVRFEEATLAHASRRAALRARRAAGRIETLPSERRRGSVPFPLAPGGRPELAIVWKNLLAWRRISLARQAAGAGALAVALFAGSALLKAPSADAAAAIGSAACLGVTAFLAVVMPLGLRIDLRGDLEYAAVLRTWPIPAGRLVLAELGAPALVAVLHAWAGIGIALAIASGRAARAAYLGTTLASPAAGFLRFEALAPVALTVAIVLPGLVTLSLVAQNASVLAFPAWFPAGRGRAVGLEQSGLRMLTFIGTALVLAVALVPAALLAGPVIFFTLKPLGLWCLPIGAALAVLPMLAETAAGVLLLARLFERFDPSRDLGP
jgi:ABC-2 type transport system permease protein